MFQLSTKINTMDFYRETLANINNDYELHDFIDDPNFDQFINLIRGEENEDTTICNFNSDLIMNQSFVDNSLLSFPSNPFDHNIENTITATFDPTSSLGSFSCFDGEAKEELRVENDGDNYSSPATTTTSITTTTTSGDTKPKSKNDRSKTLVSERRRRSRMKDKLYALRSLVPNITKVHSMVLNCCFTLQTFILWQNAVKISVMIPLWRLQNILYMIKFVLSKTKQKSNIKFVSCLTRSSKFVYKMKIASDLKPLFGLYVNYPKWLRCIVD